jgi:HK97 family phage major capsid protein
MDLYKIIKALLRKGWASASEKKSVVSAMKELEADEQEALQDDAAAVENLPEENPADAAGDVEGEAAQKVLEKLNGRISQTFNDMKKEFDEKLSEWKEKNVRTEAKSASIDDLVDNKKLKDFASHMKDEKGSLMLELKDFDFRAKSVPGDISVADNYDGTVALSQLDPAISRAPQRQPFIEQLVSVGTINSPLDVWIETTGQDGEPAPVAELALIPQKDYDFTEKSAPVKKIGVHAKYSAEMAEDLPNVLSEVRNFLIADLRRVVDTQILTGDGTGENLTGILENAVEYSAGGFAGTVLEANRFDVIETAVNQVLVGLHDPDYIVVHPTDRSKMNLTKGTDGHYVLPPFISADGLVVSGVRVIANTGITAGTFLVGDFRKSSVKYRRGLTVEFTNSDQDDFVRDRFTVKATVRVVQRVRENDYEAFVTGNFDTAIAALEIGS